MALRDYEAFIRQCVAAFDPNLDTTPGSPFDNKVIQPLERRLGPDPFSVDLMTFVIERLRQAYPQMATGEADTLTDLLVKPVTLLWDPLVRENTRVRRNLSFADPSTLTAEEADSLGGNFFVPRQLGKFSQGTGRVYFATPQQITVTQNNFVTALGGLIFVPTSVQSIRSEEMLLNIDTNGLYYIDISLIASAPGSAYDITPNTLSSIANIPSAVQITNLARFQGGDDEESPVDYAGRLQQGLGEKSLVTLRGAAAKLLEAFPAINRLNLVGAGDPEMQRDVLTGGGLGPIVASGTGGVAISDGGDGAFTRRFFTNEVNFDDVVGSETDFVLTVFGAVSGVAAAVDIAVQRVVDQNSVDLVSPLLVLTTSGIAWMLRQTQLTLSTIPGGILFPNTPNGELVVPSGTIHIGGAFDSYVRGNDFDTATLALANVAADTPLISGVHALVTDNTGGGVTNTSLVTLADLLLGGNYQAGDSTDTVLATAEYEGYAFQLENGPNTGTYRILEYFPASAPGGNPALRVAGALAVSTLVPARWRLFSDIDVNLIEPKQTHVSGQDLVATQGSALVTTEGDISFTDFGVSKGDTLRILDGPNAGDYTIIANPLVPDYYYIQVDRALAFSSTDTSYTVFTPNSGSLTLPLVRITSVELLDSSAQPLGSFIPYAKPIDIQSRSFQNAGQGVKHDLRNVRVGLVSLQADPTSLSFVIGVGATTLTFYFPTLAYPAVTVTLTPGAVLLTDLIDQLNELLLVGTGGIYAEVIVQVNTRQFGVRPVGDGFVALIGGTARTTLFGYADLRTTADIRTDEGDTVDNWWGTLNPAIDPITGLDVVQIIDGRNSGFYAGPFLLQAQDTTDFPQAAASRALLIGSSLDALSNGGVCFAPDAQRHVILGSRSLGSARVYFLEPTTFEVNANTVFTYDAGATGFIQFIPDPTLNQQQIPPLPNGVTPTDGVATAAGTSFSSASQDFLLSGINIGDQLFIDNIPLAGTVALTNPVVGAAGTTLIYSIQDSPDRQLVLVRDDPTIPANAVTMTGIINQINASIGLTVASYNASNQLTFSTSLPFVIRAQGTANPILLGDILGYAGPRAFSDEDTSNASPYSLEDGYTVTDVGTTTLGVMPVFTSSDPNWPATMTNQTFRVLRKGVQRVSTTQMAVQIAEAGLYYVDVQLVSMGAGDFWNITDSNQMTAMGYKSDGYYLTTADSNLTFSLVERPTLIVSRTILEQGVDDDPRNATQVSGQNLQIAYDRSDLVGSVQAFEMSETERVVCASPLSRHLIPHFVRFDMTYYGGSDESVVLADVQTYIKNIYPTDGLDASEVQQLAGNRGATKVTNPLTLLAVVHYEDRSVYIQRSQDSLGVSRLNAFFPDVLNITRSLSSTSNL